MVVPNVGFTLEFHLGKFLTILMPVILALRFWYNCPGYVLGGQNKSEHMLSTKGMGDKEFQGRREGISEKICSFETWTLRTIIRRQKQRHKHKGYRISYKWTVLTMGDSK